MTGLTDQIGIKLPISVHIPRGGDDNRNLWSRYIGRISIHIPRGGDDDDAVATICERADFNPHPPWGG